MEKSGLNIKKVSKFSAPKMVDMLISVLIAVGGLIMIILGFKDDGSLVGLMFGGWLVLIFGIVLFITACLIKDKYFEIDGHKVRVFAGFSVMKIEIDDKVEKKSALLTVASKDLTSEVEGLKVWLHLNGWGVSTIFFNDKKYLG